MTNNINKPGFISSEIRNSPAAKTAMEGEPVFILVAHDPQAAHVIRLWASIRSMAQGPCEQTDQALNIADQMDKWRMENGE